MLSIRCAVKLINGNARCESIAVSPCPGKCFPLDKIPALCIPFIKAVPFCATLFLSSPKERFPIIGLLGFVLISNTGAKFICTPIRLE